MEITCDVTPVDCLLHASNHKTCMYCCDSMYYTHVHHHVTSHLSSKFMSLITRTCKCYQEETIAVFSYKGFKNTLPVLLISGIEWWTVGSTSSFMSSTICRYSYSCCWQGNNWRFLLLIFVSLFVFHLFFVLVCFVCVCRGVGVSVFIV